MFNSVILDVAIALAFTYLLLALVCTTVNEWVSGILKTRGRMLAKGIDGMLSGQLLPDNKTSFLTAFQQHAMISSLCQDPNSPPSYISSKTFALAVMDLVTTPGSIDFDDLETGIKSLPEGCVKKSLLAAIQTAHGDLDQAQAAIESWFNSTMDRVSGWYTRRKQWISVVLAALVTVGVNADSLSIANKLWVNPTLRQEIVSRASGDQENLKTLISARYPDPKNPLKADVQYPMDQSLSSNQKLLGELGDLIGWRTEIQVDKLTKPSDIISHFPGWLLTIAAVSLGAPFWFDILNRFMNLRAAGKSPAEEGKGPRKGAAA